MSPIALTHCIMQCSFVVLFQMFLSPGSEQELEKNIIGYPVKGLNEMEAIIWALYVKMCSLIVVHY